MQNSNTNYPDTAISTWSGFLYQGKVAIYHVLKLIFEKDDYSDYKLQLDSLDDFAILNKDNNAKSLHQVKALKSNRFSSYKKAFVNLNAKDSSNGTEYYFHTATEITDKTKDEIQSEYTPVKLYEYEGNQYNCPLDKIDYEIKNLIKSIYEKEFPDQNYRCSDDYLTKTLNYLDEIVIKQVIKIHEIIHKNLQSETQAAYTQTINFSEFNNILNLDLNQTDLGKDYYLYMVIKDLHRYYQEFCFDNQNSLSEEKGVLLSSYMLNVEFLDTDCIVRFIKNIIPDRVFRFETLSDYRDNTPGMNGIKRGLLKILSKLCESTYSKNYNYYYWNSQGKIYMPTTITDGDSNASDVCLGIVKNALNGNLETMNEGDCLITTDIVVDSILNQVPTVTSNYIEQKEQACHICKWKKISLVRLEDVERIINANNS